MPWRYSALFLASDEANYLSASYQGIAPGIHRDLLQGYESVLRVKVP
jgi:hypothetical protein